MDMFKKKIWKKDKNTGYEVYEALYDYTAVSADDLTFRQGDELEVVEGPNRGEKWWRAHNKTTGMVGYVPSNFVKKRENENTATPPQRSSIPPVPTTTTTTTTGTMNKPPLQLPSSPHYVDPEPGGPSSTVYSTLPHTPSPLTTTTTTTTTTTGKTYVALYDFTATDSDGVSFKRGDRLTVQEGVAGMGGGGLWWWGTLRPLHTSDSQVGFVPKNYFIPEDDFRAQPWYAGGVTRQETMTLLLSPFNTTGAFLVRDAETSQGYSLSVLDNGEVRHYRVRENTFMGQGSSNKHYFVKEGQLFSDIGKLVQHYQLHDGLCVRLTEPYKTSESTVRQLEEAQKEGKEGIGKPEWEIDRNSIKLEKKLGMGNFGEVWGGTWANNTQVAVKYVKEGCMEVEEFKREAEVMRCLRHPRLVKLYGVCSQPPNEPLLIVTEMVKHGALLQYLRKRKSNKLPHPIVELVNMGVQVAAGMAYLEERQFVHRDLAARNVLIGDNVQVKIADFGLARVVKEGLYEQNSDDGLPVRWTAPEALDRRLFSTKSDVWSYGILLFEIFTHGETPYSDMRNREVREKVRALYRLPQPAACPNEMYSIMVRCWMAKPHARPRFKHIREEMEPLLKKFSS